MFASVTFRNASPINYIFHYIIIHITRYFITNILLELRLSLAIQISPQKKSVRSTSLFLEITLCEIALLLIQHVTQDQSRSCGVKKFAIISRYRLPYTVIYILKEVRSNYSSWWNFPQEGFPFHFNSTILFIHTFIQMNMFLFTYYDFFMIIRIAMGVL